MILNYGNKLVSPVMLAAPLMRNDTPLSNNFIKIIKSSPRFAVFVFYVLCLYFVSRNYTSLRQGCRIFCRVLSSDNIVNIFGISGL